MSKPFYEMSSRSYLGSKTTNDQFRANLYLSKSLSNRYEKK